MNKQILVAFVSLFFITGCMGMMPDLGIENGQLKKCPDLPNCVNSQSNDKKHFIEPILINASSLEAKKYILDFLENFKQSKIVVVEKNYIRAEFVSKFFRFVDDVEFYFPESDTNKLIIHVRSASRVGFFDFGVNRKRIESIRKKFMKL